MSEWNKGFHNKMEMIVRRTFQVLRELQTEGESTVLLTGPLSQVPLGPCCRLGSFRGRNERCTPLNGEDPPDLIGMVAGICQASSFPPLRVSEPFGHRLRKYDPGHQSARRSGR